MQNFADVTRTFLARNAAVQVRSPDLLASAMAELLASPARRAELGRNALEVVAENLGAVDRTVEMILEKLRARGIYIAPGR
jgi:3-deoxy-D-manno-octulosonic-acid transferase